VERIDPAPPRPIDPALLGPLEEGSPPPPGDATHELFPGDRRYLGRAARRARRILWSKLAGTVNRVLPPDERVLYVAQVMRSLRIGQFIAFGWLAYSYNRVALVLTDRRLLEIVLDVQGRRQGGGLRSLPWSAATGAQLRLGTLKVKPGSGKPWSWTVRLRGDKRVLKALLPRIRERLLSAGGGAAGQGATDHCPRCGEARPVAGPCAACSATPRSRGLAAALALAFPGAGQLYAGHPWLALFDFLGEALLFTVVAVGLLTSPDAATSWGLVTLGAIVFALTKLESVHVSRLLLDRGAVEDPERRGRWRKVVAPGALVSLLAILGALALTGRGAPTVERDLAFAAQDWSVSRDPAEWLDYADDPTLRAQWRHRDGWTAYAFAYPLAAGNDLASFRAAFLDDMRPFLVEEGDLPGPIPGFRTVVGYTTPDGTRALQLDYFLFDRDARDIHQLLIDLLPEDREAVEPLVEELVLRAEWIDAVL